MANHRISLADKIFIKERANSCCEYCKFPFSYSHDAFHIDHIIPPLKGGTDELVNLAWACDRCNSKKWTRTEWPDPETGILVSLYHPRTDKWENHFSWNDDFTLVTGLTPKGRATLELLQLNRPGLVNIRQVLHAWGVHPSQ